MSNVEVINFLNYAQAPLRLCASIALVAALHEAVL